MSRTLRAKSLEKRVEDSTTYLNDALQTPVQRVDLRQYLLQTFPDLADQSSATELELCGLLVVVVRRVVAVRWVGGGGMGGGGGGHWN